MKSDPKFPRFVFILTDGEVDSPRSVLKLVKDNSKDTKFHSFGIGSGASKYLVDGCAQNGGGFAHYIENTFDLNTQVIRALELAVVPALTSTELSLGPYSDVSVLSYPLTKSNIYLNQYYITLHIFKGDQAMRDLIDKGITINLKAWSTANQEEVELIGDLSSATRMETGVQLF